MYGVPLEWLTRMVKVLPLRKVSVCFRLMIGAGQMVWLLTARRVPLYISPYRMRDVQETFILTYENDIIRQATVVKFFGVHRDCFLSFKLRITHTRSLILHQSSVLQQVNSFLPPDVTLSLYYVFFFCLFFL